MRSFWIKFGSIVFSIIAVYTFLWAVIEPVPVSRKYEWHRYILLIVAAGILVIIAIFRNGLLSYIYYRHIRPIFLKNHQVLSNFPAHESLVEGWKQFPTGVISKPEIVEDILFEKVCKFDEHLNKDALRELSVTAMERGEKIDYFIKPLTSSAPVVYVRVDAADVTNPQVKKSELKWLTLELRNVHSGSVSFSNNEETIFVNSKAAFMGWMFFSEDIKVLFSSIDRWKRQFRFNKIVALKVRGSFCLASITVYE